MVPQSGCNLKLMSGLGRSILDLRFYVLDWKDLPKQLGLKPRPSRTALISTIKCEEL